ncbi:MAG: hypothetical protein IJ415_04285, partial [Clostridia bacterium]|nr:hypothetical protein [Clostridia bacterium]
MFEVFKYVDKFFTSLTNYLTYNDIFIIFVGLIILITINYIFFTNETVDITHFGDDHLNSENVTHKEENKEH